MKAILYRGETRAVFDEVTRIVIECEKPAERDFYFVPGVDGKMTDGTAAEVLPGNRDRGGGS